MNSLFLAYLSMSVTGTGIALLLLLLKPVFKDRFSKRWQYYIFLVVLLRLLIPFSPEINLMDRILSQGEGLFPLHTSGTGLPADEFIGDVLTEDGFAEDVFSGDGFAANGSTGDGSAADGFAPSAPDGRHTAAPTALFQRAWSALEPLKPVFQSLWLVWAVTAALLLMKKAAAYHGLLRSMKTSCQAIGDEEIHRIYAERCAAMNVKRPPQLCLDESAPSPMLIGMLRPRLLLPDIDLDRKTLGYILQHELIHYKRMDLAYKWLMQLAVCLHWYNPFVYWISREIGNCCELSCDEAIIKDLCKEEKYDYGDTLLSAIKPNNGHSNSIAAVSLSENTKFIKERLGAIMTFRKKSVTATLLSVLLAVGVLTGATFSGVYTVSEAAGSPRSNTGGLMKTLPGNDEIPSLGVPQTSKFNQVPAEAKLGFGPYELKAGSQYAIKMSWTSGGNEALKVNIIDKNSRAAVQEFTLQNGEEKTISVAKDGAYAVESPRARANGLIRGFEYSFHLVGDNAMTGKNAAGQAAAGKDESPIQIGSFGIEYDDSIYRWPSVVFHAANRSGQAIQSYEVGVLPYDKDGKPLELYWNASNVDKNGDYGNVGWSVNGVDYGDVVGIHPNAPKSYDWVLEGGELQPGASAEDGYWTLFDGWWDQPGGVHKASYFLSCVKSVTYEDGTVWSNPNYESWLKQYRGVSVELDVLEGYYSGK